MTVVNGGSDSSQSEVQSFMIGTNEIKHLIQSIAIYLPIPLYDVQEISIYSQSSISGSFYLSYNDHNSNSILFNEATDIYFQGLLQYIPTIGAVKVTRSRYDHSYGFNWLITFTSYSGARDLLVVHSDELISENIIDVKVTKIQNGSYPIIDHYLLLISNGLNNLTVGPISVFATSDIISEHIYQLSNESIIIESTDTSHYFIRKWNYTYPLGYSYKVIEIQYTRDYVSEFLPNKQSRYFNFSITVIQNETKPVNGLINFYIPEVIEFSSNSSLELIQSLFIIDDSLILVDRYLSDYFQIYTLTYPIKFGNVSNCILSYYDYNTYLNQQYACNTIRHGNYSQISGSFKLTVDGISTNPLDYNISSFDLHKELISTNNNLQFVNVDRYEGIIDYLDAEYYGFQYNITLLNYKYLPNYFFNYNNYESNQSVYIRKSLSDSLFSVHSNISGIFEFNLVQMEKSIYQSIELSFDGQHYITTNTMLTIVEPITILSINPTFGTVLGNTEIILSLDNLNTKYLTMDNSIQCLFNDTIVTGEYIFRGYIKCKTPAFHNLLGGKVFVHVSINNQVISQRDNATVYTYIPIASYLSITPSFGNINGNTNVNISGVYLSRHLSTYLNTNLSTILNIYCKFGNQIVKAGGFIEGKIICYSPSVSFPQDVLVSFSLNGYDYEIESYLVYRYKYNPVVTRIDPNRGSIYGNTLIKITGQNFDISNEYLNRSTNKYITSPSTFIDNYNRSDISIRFNNHVVKGYINNDESIYCYTPPLDRKYEIQTITTGLLPYQPLVKEITASTSPLSGDTLQIIVNCDNWIPQIDTLTTSVDSVDEIQRVTIGLNLNPPRVVEINVNEVGRLPEIQSITTRANYFPEIQALFIRAPYTNIILEKVDDIQEVYISNTDSIVTLGYDGYFNISFNGLISTDQLQTLLQEHYDFAYDCFVFDYSVDMYSYRNFSITYNNTYGVSIPKIYVNLNNGYAYAKSINRGGYQEIQHIIIEYEEQDFFNAYLRLELEDEYSSNIFISSNSQEIKSILQDVPTIGIVDVSIIQQSTTSILWMIVFNERLGQTPNLIIDSFHCNASVYSTRPGTTAPINGHFTIQLGDYVSNYLSTTSSANEVQYELRNFSTSLTENLVVTKYSLLNNGVMFLIHFSELCGDVDQLTVNNIDINGTNVYINIDTYQNGLSINGKFLLTSQAINKTTTDLSFDCTSEALKNALEIMDPNIKPLIVTRTTGEVIGTFSWLITFPYSVGRYNILDINGAGLSGYNLTATVTELQIGRTPSIQRIRTSGSSQLSGHFYISLQHDNITYTSVSLSYNASEADIVEALDSLPNIGDVIVSKIQTGSIDLSTWNDSLIYDEYTYDNVDLTNDYIHLNSVKSYFQYDLITNDWLITFVSKSDYMPLLSVCCDEMNTANRSEITLLSEWSGDSLITVDNISNGTMKSLYGNISIEIGELKSSYLSIYSTESEIISAFSDVVDITQIKVSRTISDVNGHYKWLITFSQSVIPVFDFSIISDVVIDQSQLYPIYSKQFMTYKWLFDPVRYNLQIINFTDSNIIYCRYLDTSIQIDINYNNTELTNLFNSLYNHIIGNIHVNRLDNTLFIYLLEYYHQFSGFDCDNGDAYIAQEFQFTNLSGNYSIIGSLNDLIVKSTDIPTTASLEDITLSLAQVYGTYSTDITHFISNSTDITFDVRFYGNNVGGNIPAMQLDITNLIGTNVYFKVITIVRGEQINGFIYINNSLSAEYLSVNSNSQEVESSFRRLLTDVENLTVTITGPTRHGGFIWYISYYKKSDYDSYYRNSIHIDKSYINGSNANAIFSTIQSGTHPLSGYYSIGYLDAYGDTTSVTLSYNASLNEMKKALEFLNYESYYKAVITSKLLNNAGSIEYNITLFDGMVLPYIPVVHSKSLTGDNVNIVAKQIGYADISLNGIFQIEYNSYMTGFIDISISADQLYDYLILIPGISDITVDKTFSSNSYVQWLITFNSLQYINNNPNLILSSRIFGRNAEIHINTYKNSYSIPIYQISIDNSTVKFDLYWNNYNHYTAMQYIGKIDSNYSVSEIENIFDNCQLFSYFKISKSYYVNVSNIYVLAIPKHLTNYNDIIDSYNFKHLSSSNNNINISIIQPDHSINISNGGSFKLSLDDIGCIETKGGTWCSTTYLPIDQSNSINILSSNSFIESAVESLRSVELVDVTSSVITNRYLNDSQYIIYGRQYDITFIETYNNASGSIATDLNSNTWTPEDSNIRFDGPPEKSTFLTIPLLKSNKSNLINGWDIFIDRKQFSDYSVNSSTVSVEVSINNQDYSTNSVTFSYDQVTRIYRINPSYGPIRGNTEVYIYGFGFKHSSQLSCQFGNGLNMIVHAAFYFNSSLIVCQSPPALFSQQVFVRVSNNGFFDYNDSSTLSDGIIFTYHQEFSISSVFPPLGPSSGNFSVKVNGGPFNRTDQIRCKFGYLSVKAVYKSIGEIQCFAPAHPPGVYPIEVTVNEQDYSTTRTPFFFYNDQALSRIQPVSGPATSGGTEVNVYGSGFVNSSYLICRFGITETVGRFVTSNYIICPSPPLDITVSGGLTYTALSEQFNQNPTPSSTGVLSTALFPNSYFYPLYESRLVTVEVSNNNQDYTDSGISFLYQADAYIDSVLPNVGQVDTLTAIVVKGNNFVNSTSLRCRIGEYVTIPTFLATNLVLCFTPQIPLQQADYGYVRTHQTLSINTPQNRATQTSPFSLGPNVVYVEVANNGQDYTNNRKTFTFNIVCKSGYYCPQLSNLPCPPGTFCNGEFNSNFTLCPKGTYNPSFGQASCYRCPIGFICPEEGMHVPRICPPGYVCEFTGMIIADNPCPEGHFCLEGTATSATTCGSPDLSSDMFPIVSHAERPSTLRKNRIALGQDLVLGARNSGCWLNYTDDVGLQVSDNPAQFWMERHLLPLALDSPFTAIRGQICLDDQCLHLSDLNDFQTSDYAFDYSASSFKLRRPIPCPTGMYCHPGTAVDTYNSYNFSTPQPCYESMYCPEGSADPTGSGECPVGFYCPFGVKIACPVGTYCPRDGHWDPFPCSPGTFNGQTGMASCTQCPRGFICPGFGRVDPALCPAGFVCSKQGLHAPNNRCPAGYYCPNGTLTIDPFRNDTTLRPYPCKPGTYCLTGVGYSEVVVGNFFYAQYCAEGFYCEAASNSPRGNGICPQGFVCPLGTATPKPAPKGSYAELEGTIQAANCLPGYYAPTIETVTCYPCPPGTSCESEGTYVADICPPGTFRSTINEDGIPCASCPEGTWSKNYELRERGECTLCGPGMVCPIEGMTNPCGHSDLPTPYEPVVNYQGNADYEYNYPSYNKPGYFTYLECLNLNIGYSDGTMYPSQQKYFFGELIPPYIDVLGRGPNFRATNQDNVKFSSTAKCYVNTQRYGSAVYQRLADFFGPQYDIQYNHDYQGYGMIYTNGSYYYDGFFGEGSLYIDLPHARVFEPSYNCTKGFLIMNSTTVLYDSDGQTTTVYTDVNHDPTGISRAIPKGEDQLYPGTCEADIICYFAVSNTSSAQSLPCSEGYICDQETTSSEESNYLCRAGYVCDYGTTPDPNILSPQGQFKTLCPAGYYCGDGLGLGQAYRNICPVGYYCPTGTGDYYVGIIAGDASNRGLNETTSNPYLYMENVQYIGQNDVRVLSRHDKYCLDGIDNELALRYQVDWLGVLQQLNNPSLLYLRNVNPGHPPYTNDSFVTGYEDREFYRPVTYQESLLGDLNCARDHKWRLIDQTIYRKECNCTNFFHVVIATYRLWKCTGNGALDDLGIGSINKPFFGGRDYWFERWNYNNTICLYPDSTSNYVNLTFGGVDFNPSLPSIGISSNRLLDLTYGVELQFTWSNKMNFTTYKFLKSLVETEYSNEYEELVLGTRSAMDPYIFNLKRAIEKVEEFGDKLTTLVWLNNSTPGRLDMCECERLMKCPNGTTSSAGSSGWTDCTSLQSEVLRRISVIPSWYNDSTPELSGFLYNSSDFWELSGGDSSLSNGTETYKIGTIVMGGDDVAVVTLDFRDIERNLTYGVHYQISVYIDCKPCPARYICDYTQNPATCSYPSITQQRENFNECLKRYKQLSCATVNGSRVDCSNNSSHLSFLEPDLYKCNQIPYFCDSTTYNNSVWNILTGLNGKVLPREDQENSYYVDNTEFLSEVSAGLATKRTVLGCCSCERHWMPYYFQDSSEVATGYPDNKHNYIQFSILALEYTELTIVVELLHGQYISQFDGDIPNKGDIFIHRPTRAINLPSSNPSRAAFVAIILQSQFGSSLDEPLNLPIQTVRNPGQSLTTLGGDGTYYYTYEKSILMGRTTDLYQADPIYETRYQSHMVDLYIDLHNTSVNFNSFANIPNLKEIGDTLESINDPYSSVYEPLDWWNTEVPNSAGFLGLPYLPFFSNCRGSGNYLSLSKVLETDPYCDLVGYENTVAVSPYFWNGQVSPNADKCNTTTTPDLIYKTIGNETIQWLGSYHGALFQCYFEEEIDASITAVRWYEQGAASVLWYFGSEPFYPTDYEGQYSINSDGSKSYSNYWGMGNGISKIIGTYKAISVTVDLVDYGQQNVIPRQVVLNIWYYQVTKSVKRIIKSTVQFLPEYSCYTLTSGGSVQAALASQGIPQCVLDINGIVASSDYQLEIFYQPLSWRALLNAFAFTPPIYMLFFLASGAVAVASAALLWSINRIFTRLKNPPPFHGVSFFLSVTRPILLGLALGFFPTMIAILFVWKYFQDPADGGSICSSDPVNNPSKACLENIVDWQQSALGNLDGLIQLRNGRKMIACFAICFYAVFVSAELIYPNWSKEDIKTDAQRLKDRLDPEVDFVTGNEDSNDYKVLAVPETKLWKPHVWRRTNFIFMIIAMVCCMMIHMEFSYSTIFSLLTYYFIILFKVIYFIIENFIAEHYLGDKLAVAPLFAAANCVGNLATMGASDFTQFLVSFFENLFWNYFERLYLSPYIEYAFIVSPRYTLFIQRLFQKRRLTRDQKAKEEMEWREMNEEIEIELESISLMVDNYCDYAIDTAGTVLCPPVYATLKLFYYENLIASNYAIKTNQIVYFISFAAIIIPFIFITDIYVLNCQELIRGWKVYDYVSYQNYRFSVREFRWMMRNPNYDESIIESMQTIDILCFSSQFYFLMGLLSLAMMQMILAITGILRLGYNPFGDPCFLLLFILAFLIGEISLPIFAALADIQIKSLNWRGLWAIRQVEGTIDDDIAAKLAVGETKQADLEQERIELQALNSDRFKHKFLEKNRPWILQRLVELLTPRSLEKPGPDGRPTIEYVRDVYAELMSLGEGYRKPGERPDISSDDEDDLENLRRNWPRIPLKGPALTIALIWLAKARKRRAFSKLVKEIVESNKKDYCELCNRTVEKNKIKLTCYLATNNLPNFTAIDILIAEFENLYGSNEMDSNLWKAFFRGHAQYITQCSICDKDLDSSNPYNNNINTTLLDDKRLVTTRPQDISSSDDEVDEIFDPLVVTRTSPEGRMMSKWLLSARKKLGGKFPRLNARNEMEKYAQKLRNLKLKKNKDQIRSAATNLPSFQANVSNLYSNTTIALGKRWIQLAKESIDRKFKLKSSLIREELELTLKSMKLEDDWYYTSQSRNEGKELIRHGYTLQEDRMKFEAEASVKINEIEKDWYNYITAKESEINNDKQQFNNKLNIQNDKILYDIEIRKNELLKLKNEKLENFQKIEKKAALEYGAAPTELIQQHRNFIIEIDNLLNSEKDKLLLYKENEEKLAIDMFNSLQDIKLNEIKQRRQLVDENIQRIYNELNSKIRQEETEWQLKANKWLVINKRKVEIKKQEDEQAKIGKNKRLGTMMNG